MSNKSTLKVVDLFSGCGGLSLGFDAYRSSKGESVFETILAMDNWKPAVEVFKNNHPLRAGADMPIGRTADLSWFDHPSEALLYYLTHYAASLPDAELKNSLTQIGVPGFLASINSIDKRFSAELKSYALDKEHIQAFSCIDNKVFSLALCKSLLGKLHLSSLREPSLNFDSLPWVMPENTTGFDNDYSYEKIVSPEALDNAVLVWSRAILQMKNAAASTGRGQHSGNAARMETLYRYFNSSVGEKLRSSWTSWYAARLAARIEFCLGVYENLKDFYSEDRRVEVLLGGPPCKGFSRIGRAVIRELREQGAHAWSCNKFGDERNALMYHYVVFLEALRPKVFLFENVSNFASKLKTPDGDLDAPQLLKELIDSLECDDLKYDISARIVKAKEHAVPQARERYIMCGVALQVKCMAATDVLAIDKQDSEVTLGEALTGLSAAKIFREEAKSSAVSSYVVTPKKGKSAAASKFFEWVSGVTVKQEQCTSLDAHIYRKPREDDARLYKLLAPGVRWMDLKTPASDTLYELKSLLTDVSYLLKGVVKYEGLVSKSSELSKRLNDSLALRLLLEQASVGLAEPHHLLGEGYLSNGSGQHGDWLERLSASKPCKTIVAHIGKDTYGYVHPFEARPITIREAARIQSFPDWFSFAGAGVVDTYMMIGNAVPPLLALQFAEKIARCLTPEIDRHPVVELQPKMQHSFEFLSVK